jgi:hypothetical protein
VQDTTSFGRCLSSLHCDPNPLSMLVLEFQIQELYTLKPHVKVHYFVKVIMGVVGIMRQFQDVRCQGWNNIFRSTLQVGMGEAMNNKDKFSGGDKVVISGAGYCDSTAVHILIVLRSHSSQKKVEGSMYFQHSRKGKTEMKVVWIQEVLANTNNHVIIKNQLHMIYR